MKRTAREGVKRGKHRAARQKVAPSEEITSDINNSAGHKTTKPSAHTPGNTLDKERDVVVETLKNGRLPPLVPPVKISPQKSSDIELHERQSKGKNKRAVDSEEDGLGGLRVVKDKSPPRASSPATRRRNENMTSYERMLQREKRKSRKISGSYTILHSEPEEERDSLDDHAQTLVFEDGTNVSRSKTTLRSRPSSATPSRQDPNQDLLQYFAKLTSSFDVDDPLDLEYIRSLLHEGASVNTSDRFGQTLLHEVSRTWGVDVAQFLIDQGADINKADDYGRTPLHVAASADYPEMARFLIDNGAEVHARTAGEDQTPLHYAAKNEAVQCVKILLAYGADIDVRDYKLRTPLQVAAEHNSAEATRALMDEGSSAGVTDDSGMSALSLLISQMPVVAYRALDQFHSVNRIHRKQNFYLNFLENCESPKEVKSPAPSPLQAASLSNCLELVMHPIFQRLIDVKWRYFRLEAWLDILPNMLMTILYTVLACSMPQDVSTFYKPLSKQWWKIVVEIVFAFIMFNEIRKEVRDYYRSKKQSKKLIKWRRKEVERDLAFCHPRWPQERTFVEQELRRIKQEKGNKQIYFSDAWNYLDWIAYAMLIVVIILHFINVYIKHTTYNDVFVRILSCTLIPVWVRLLKYARPFPVQGPFVVMLDHIILDTSKWLFVILMFYIPYGAAFWIMFGPWAQTPVHGYNSATSLIYTIIRIPLLDDYNFAELAKAAPYMSRVLCGSFILIAAIVLMNLYIALLSNTFQRVYDNARATAAIQRARLLQDLELDASAKKLKRYREFISTNYSPEEADYIAVLSEQEEQNRKQEEKVSEIHNIVSKRFGGRKFGKLERSEFDTLMEDVNNLKRSHSEVKRSLCLLTLNLEELQKTTTLLLENRMCDDHERCHKEQEDILERMNLTVKRLEAVYAIDNGRNPGKVMRNHKANQTDQ